MSRLTLIKSSSVLAFAIAALAASPAAADFTPECNDAAVAGTECGTGSIAGDGATAVGYYSTATGLFAVAVGQASTADADNATAVGTLAMATGVGSTAIGTGAIASGDDSIAIGINAGATGLNSVAIGANSVADQDNTVSVGSVGGERRIVNVAAGTATTDAVNFGQLNATNTAVTAIQAVNTTQDGQITAIQAINTTQSSQITAIQTLNTTQSGQITALQAADSAFQSQLDGLDFDLSRDRKDARAGTASALAVAALPQASGEGRTMIAGGVGTYRGRHALAIGASHRLQGGNGTFKVGVTYDSEEHVGANGGFGFEF